MAVKNKPPLTLIDIVTRADVETIKAALEARVKIDDLLVIREEAYKKIYDIETEIEGIVGEEGSFDYGDAPYPVAGLTKKKPVRKAKPAVKKASEVSSEDVKGKK